MRYNTLNPPKGLKVEKIQSKINLRESFMVYDKDSFLPFINDDDDDNLTGEEGIEKETPEEKEEKEEPEESESDW